MNDSCDLNIYFIISNSLNNKSQCDVAMHSAFEICKKYINNCYWIKEKEHKNIPRSKKSVVVFQEFEGNVFDSLRKEEVLIVGPRCLKTCLLERIPIPNGPNAVFTIPMLEMIICLSGFPAKQKKKMEQKIEYMGGVCFSEFTSNVTHLVCDKVNTIKYAKAKELKIPVMLSSWVEAVWNENLIKNKRADNEEFNQYQCPLFYKLNVSTSGFSKKERLEISKLIEDNGGIYSGRFESQTTNLLICNPNATGEKYKAAKNFNIDCCTIKWIHDCIKLDEFLPFDKYQIEVKPCISSTLLHGEQSQINADFSYISTINNETETKNISTVSKVPSTSKHTTLTFNDNDFSKDFMKGIEQKLDDIDMKQVKKAGQFLDSCEIFLLGFEMEKRDKLCKILNLGGAVRYDEMSSRITHVLVGEENTADINKFFELGYHPSVVNIDWLIASMHLKSPAPEESYKVIAQKSPSKKMINTAIPPSSPLSQKSVQMLINRSTSASKILNPEINTDILDEFLEPNVIEEYTKTNTNDVMSNYFNETRSKKKLEETSEKTDVLMAPLDNTSMIFNGLTFIVSFWQDIFAEQIVDMITSSGGTMLNNTSEEMADYAVIPLEAYSKKVKAKHVVTNYWVEDCIDNEKIIDVFYYHCPIEFNKNSGSKLPLTGCNITLSSYKSWERTFIINLTEALGANYEDSLSKRNNKKGVPATTHLICPAPIGSKYTAAIKWGITIVTHHWLLACARKNEKVLESDFNVPQSEEESKIEKTSITSARHTANASIKTNANTPQQSGTPHQEPPSTYTKDDINLENTPVYPVNISNASSISKQIPSKNLTKTFALNDESLKNSPIAMLETSKPIFNRNSVNISAQKCPETSEKEFDVTDKIDHIEPDQQELFPSNLKPLLERFEEHTGGDSESPLRSQMTPVAKFLEKLGLPKMNVSNITPGSSSSSIQSPTHIDTPETPLGRCFGNPNPSPETRKYWAKRINALPSYHHSPPVKRARRDSTPLSELKRQLWKKILPSESDSSNIESSDETNNISESPKNEMENYNPTSSNIVSNQVQQLKEMIERRSFSDTYRRSLFRRSSDQSLQPTTTEVVPKAAVTESQNDTIGWEDPLEAKPAGEKTFKKFMLSHLSNEMKIKYVDIIKSLGGEVSDLPSLFDTSATHLICSVPSRSEKFLASIAAGKWILNSAYLEDSKKAGVFLKEELYEYGNPSAKISDSVDGENSSIVPAIYKWRKEIQKTKRKAYFGMNAVVFMNTRRDSIVRLIEAGGGNVMSSATCYEDANITHCFVDAKQLNDFFSDCTKLAAIGVPCLHPIVLSHMLLLDSPLDCSKYIIPELVKAYKTN